MTQAKFHEPSMILAQLPNEGGIRKLKSRNGNLHFTRQEGIGIFAKRKICRKRNDWKRCGLIMVKVLRSWLVSRNREFVEGMND